MPDIFEQGAVLLLDKPYDWTSFDVVRKVRNQLKIKKVGHAGTLDPLATGLLILCTGKFTKKINEYMAREKEYTGSFTIGATTPTYDLESSPEDHVDISSVTVEQIHEATKPLIGDILQLPPMHSAIKKDGKRLYELARKGITVEMEPRPVSIREFSITRIEIPMVYFRIVCTTGTYIRSMASDYGRILGCGAYLSSLCRTRIGEFHLSEAYSIEQVTEYIQSVKDQNG